MNPVRRALLAVLTAVVAVLALAAPAGAHDTTLSNGTRASVKSVSGGGGGTMDLDLAKVLPTTLKADNHVEMSLELQAANGPRPLDVEMKLSLEATSP